MPEVGASGCDSHGRELVIDLTQHKTVSYMLVESAIHRCRGWRENDRSITGELLIIQPGAPCWLLLLLLLLIIRLGFTLL